MPAGLEVKNSSGKVILTSETTPSSFYYRYRQTDTPLSNVLRAGTYYNIHTSTNSFSDWRLYETLGVSLTDSLSAYPIKPVYLRSDDGHVHFQHNNGDLAWVCCPGMIAMPMAYNDDVISSSSYPTRAPKAGASLIVTSTKSNSVRTGYLDTYKEDGTRNWSISNYFRHPNIQHVWRGPTYSEFMNTPGFTPPIMKTPYWLKSGSTRYSTPIKYKSTDGSPLYICTTLLAAYPYDNPYVPHLMWNADGTELSIQSRVFQEYEPIAVNMEFTFNSAPRIPVPIASFPSITKDYFPLE